MDEYISKQAFKEKYLCCGWLPEMSKKEFDDFPAADVAPVVRGKWEHTHTNESYFNECWRCSACGFDDTEGFGFKFCPNCGAKMDQLG